MYRFTTGMAIAGCLLSAPALFSAVEPGDAAPLFVSVSDEMDPVDMADFIDGTPLVFLYGSAT